MMEVIHLCIFSILLENGCQGIEANDNTVRSGESLFARLDLFVGVFAQIFVLLAFSLPSFLIVFRF